jgi:hypothetical protein
LSSLARRNSVVRSATICSSSVSRANS